MVVGVLLVLTWRLDLSTAQEDRAGGEGLTGKAGNATQTTSKWLTYNNDKNNSHKVVNINCYHFIIYIYIFLAII